MLRRDGNRLARRLRRDPTVGETRLWSWLRDRRLAGFKFRRQHPIGRYVVDFYCPQARLVVEIDGDGHSPHSAEETGRTRYLVRRKCRVVRFTNLDVELDLWEVLDFIERACREGTSGDASA
ncbi:MAG: endonuclease domain-containing protein [Anaerolineales bacterium]